MGFNGCLGYDYHPEDKSVSVNEQEAETVRMIYDLYVQGYGAYTIAKERRYPKRQEPNLRESMHSAVCACYS